MDVQTPLRMLKLRAKHAVSLAEWFHSLVSAISQTNTGLDVAGTIPTCRELRLLCPEHVEQVHRPTCLPMLLLPTSTS